MTDIIVTNKLYVIIGLGLTGLSVARYLEKKNIHFIVMDMNKQPQYLDDLNKISPKTKVYLGQFDQEILLDAYRIILSPGVPRKTKEIQQVIDAGISVINDIELFLEENRKNSANKVIGITGSNGKSTVTTLVGMAAEIDGKKVAIAGNIGVPVLDVIDKDVEIYILELSSFQLESVGKPSLNAACVLNICSDHMDRYESLASYCLTKQRIYWGAENVIYNMDDVLTIPPVVDNVKRFGFSLQTPVEQREEQLFFDEKRQVLMVEKHDVMNASSLKIKGTHNVANALAVLALCKSVDISVDAVITALKTFNGLPHRCEFVAEKNRVVYINDSKATNIGACEAAIIGLKDDFDEIFLIAGGDSKDSEFKSFGSLIGQYIAAVVLIGKDAEHIAQFIPSNVPTVFSTSMDAAVIKASELAKLSLQSRQLILLSPACASLDMFKDYRHRGMVFSQSVKEFIA